MVLIVHRCFVGYDNLCRRCDTLPRVVQNERHGNDLALHDLKYLILCYYLHHFCYQNSSSCPCLAAAASAALQLVFRRPQVNATNGDVLSVFALAEGGDVDAVQMMMPLQINKMILPLLLLTICFP